MTQGTKLAGPVGLRAAPSASVAPRGCSPHGSRVQSKGAPGQGLEEHRLVSAQRPPCRGVWGMAPQPLLSGMGTRGLGLSTTLV